MTFRHLGFTFREFGRKVTAYIAFVVMVLVVAISLIGIAMAHDSWISRGGLKNPAGEWCCGDYDCGVMVTGEAKAVAGGYEIDGVFRVVYSGKITDTHVKEFWPYRETMPSPDGATWRCHRPDGTPRCRFMGPSGS